MYPIDQPLVDVALSQPAYDIYATIINPTTHIIYRYLTEFVMNVMQVQSSKPKEEIRILDWGAGKGYVAYFLRENGFDATCYETDSFQHRLIWKEFKLPVKTSPGDTLPFKSNYFDAVVGFGVLEHVPYEYDALKEVNRVLKDDGLFFCFNLPNQYGYLHHVAHARGIMYHDRLYTRKETQFLLKRSGFCTIGKPWYRQILPKNSVKYKKFRVVESLDLFVTAHTPVKYLATSIEFVARKQYAYTSQH